MSYRDCSYKLPEKKDEVWRLRQQRKILYIAISTVIQWGVFLLLVCIYNKLFPIKHSNISIGMSMYYYLYLIAPFTIICIKLIQAGIKKYIVRVLLLALIGILSLYYWHYSIMDYPYRISFILFSLVLVLFVENWIYNKLITRFLST
jgi:hypothetical protein